MLIKYRQVPVEHCYDDTLPVFGVASLRSSILALHIASRVGTHCLNLFLQTSFLNGRVFYPLRSGDECGGAGYKQVSVDDFIAFPTTVVGHDVEVSDCPADGVGNHRSRDWG